MIGRIEENLAERDAAGRRLQNTLIKADREFRELIRLSEAASAAWPWPPSDLIPMLMSGATIARAVIHQIYKCGARPPLLGRPGEKVEVGFPGGVCADHRLRGLVDQIPSLTDVLADGSRMASRIMRGGSAEARATPAASPPAASGNGDSRSSENAGSGQTCGIAEETGATRRGHDAQPARPHINKSSPRSLRFHRSNKS